MLAKKDSKKKVNRSRRLFVISGLLILGGCASAPKNTMECMNLPSGEEQMNCLYGQMFPEVVHGVIIGAVAGAILGGAVAFALGDNPISGLIIGGIVGGVAGGVVAYYNFTLKRAAYDPNRALSDIYQDCKTDSRKLPLMADASRRAFDESAPNLKNRTTLSTLQDQNKIQKLEKDQVLREGVIQNYNEAIEVYKQTSNKIISEIRTIKEEDSNINHMASKIMNQLEKNSKYIKDIAEDVKNTKTILMKIYGVPKV